MPRRVLNFLGGYYLACTLILLLGILTWLGTLEQVDLGLYEVKRKYFSSESFFLIPQIHGKTIPVPLPSAYWVGMAFFINLLLGTLFRARWCWKTSGVLIAHFGILLLLFGAFVTQHFSQRGNMAIMEGKTSNVAEHYHDFVIEVSELEEGQPREVHVIATRLLADLQPEDQRTFRMANLPFDLQVEQYHRNARPTALRLEDEKLEELAIDGFYLKPMLEDKEASKNFASCKVSVLTKEGEPHSELLISAASYHPATIEWDDQLYSINIRKALWRMPFDVQLDRFTHELYPGTTRPKKFESHVTRIMGGRREPVLIRMNEPMRRQGYTFFQASWGPQNAAPGAQLFSVFEVVRNPADRWPEFALYITTVGLIWQFGLMLVLFIHKQLKKGGHDK